MKTWRVELTAGRKNLAESKIQRGIFQGDAQSTLLCVIAMMLLNQILRQFTGGYKLIKTQEKINHLMYIDNIKLFAKNDKELETLILAVRIYSPDRGMEFGVEKCPILIMRSGETTYNRRNGTTKSRKNQNARRKGNYKYWKLTPSNM